MHIQPISREMQMSKEQELIDAVKNRLHSEGRKEKLTCGEAFGLAKDFDVTIVEIGRICNSNKIKISKCQLGCFK